MGLFLSIRALHEEGHSKKAIARKLDLDVRTVRKYLRRIEAGAFEDRGDGVGRESQRHERNFDRLIQ